MLEVPYINGRPMTDSELLHSLRNQHPEKRFHIGSHGEVVESYPDEISPVIKRMGTRATQLDELAALRADAQPLISL